VVLAVGVESFAYNLLILSHIRRKSAQNLRLSFVTDAFVEIFCCPLWPVARNLRLFGHFCMFFIFRYLCVIVYIQLFSFRAASVCL